MNIVHFAHMASSLQEELIIEIGYLMEQMNKRPGTNSIGWLEVSFYGAALLLGLGSIVGAWTFSILIALIPLAIVCGIFRDAVALRQLTTRAKAATCVAQTETTLNRPSTGPHSPHAKTRPRHAKRMD